MWIEIINGKYWVVDDKSVWAVCDTEERAKWFVEYYAKLGGAEDSEVS